MHTTKEVSEAQLVSGILSTCVNCLSSPIPYVAYDALKQSHEKLQNIWYSHFVLALLTCQSAKLIT